MNDKPYLSSSQINMLFRCPQQYYRRYIKGERLPPAVPMITGSAAHKSIETNLKNKIEKKELLSLSAVQDIARDILKEKWKKGVKVEEGENENEATNRAVSFSGIHHKELAPIIEPIAVEQQVRVEIPKFPYDLLGYIDIEEIATIRDTKTSSRKKPETEAYNNDQLTMYALIKLLSDKKLPDKLCLDTLVVTKTGKESSQTLDTKRNKNDCKVMLRRIEIAGQLIKSGLFPPCNQSNWNCDPKWCGYADTCPYYRR